MRASGDPDRATADGLIVVGVDGSEGADAALAWALREAGLRGQVVEAVTVMPTPFASRGLSVPGLDGPTSAKDAEGVLRASLARVGGAPAVPVRVAWRYGNPGTALARAAARRADLVVIGRTSEHHGYQVLTGSVSRAIRRPATGPVVVVPVSWGRERAKGVVVVGFDGTHRARAALRWAMAEASQRRASLRAVLAWDSSKRACAAGAVAVVAGSSRTAEAAATVFLEREIHAALASFGEFPDIEVVPVATHAAAHAALLRESADADLLVLGGHCHLDVDELLFGSTTRICLGHAGCPVVLVPDTGGAQGGAEGAL